MVLAIVLRALEDHFKANRRRDRRRKYQIYLRSPEWKARRQVAITKAAGRCRDCGRPTTRFEVHHLTYRRFSREHPKDLSPGVGLGPLAHAGHITPSDPRKRAATHP